MTIRDPLLDVDDGVQPPFEVVATAFERQQQPGEEQLGVDTALAVAQWMASACLPALFRLRPMFRPVPAVICTARLRRDFVGRADPCRGPPPWQLRGSPSRRAQPRAQLQRRIFLPATLCEDMEHGFDWLRREPRVDPDRLVLLDHSVGATAAHLVAARRQTDSRGSVLRHANAPPSLPLSPGWSCRRSAAAWATCTGSGCGMARPGRSGWTSRTA